MFVLECQFQASVFHQYFYKTYFNDKQSKRVTQTMNSDFSNSEPAKAAFVNNFYFVLFGWQKQIPKQR